MNKANRKKIHEALVAAKPYLWDGKQSHCETEHLYICFAIDHAEDHAGLPWRCGVLAEEEIARRLQPEIAVHSWLRYKAKIPKELLTEKNVQAYRHRWLDALIEEFSK